MADSGFATQVAQLRHRIAALRGGEEALELEILLQDLQTAVEELRLADEEVRTQQAEVTRLLEDQQLRQWRYERMLSSLPVPVLTTDHRGQLRGVNAAAAALLGVPLRSLMSKPLFALVEPSDRGALREVVGRVVASGAAPVQQVRMRLRSGLGDVTISISPTPQAEDSLTWVLADAELDKDVDTWKAAGSLPRALAELFALAGSSMSPHEVLQQTAYLVAQTLDVQAAVSVVLGRVREPSSVASSDQTAQSVDAWQLLTGQGPTSLAAESGLSVIAPDLALDGRWSAPDTLPAALSALAVVACPLKQGAEVHGVLTAYLPAGTVLDAHLVEHVEILAASVGSLVQELDLRAHLESLSEDMRAALSSRSVIEQAKGIVMAAKSCDADEAFQHLVTLSNTGHLKLRDVAQQIVTSAGG